MKDQMLYLVDLLKIKNDQLEEQVVKNEKCVKAISQLTNLSKLQHRKLLIAKDLNFQNEVYASNKDLIILKMKT